jgi:hypothetical protein
VEESPVPPAAKKSRTKLPALALGVGGGEEEGPPGWVVVRECGCCGRTFAFDAGGDAAWGGWGGSWDSCS